MTDETRDETIPETSTAVAIPEVEGDEEDKPAKLTQTVDIREIGPCKKHIKVTVSREDVEGRRSEKFRDLVFESNVAGFRPGKAPRKLVERRFSKEVGDEVKREVLMASLEQLAEDHDIAPLASPNIDPGKIDLPADGPMVYEFEIEVRPEFDLPTYKGLKIKRQVHTFTAEEIQNEQNRLLAPYGQVVPKPEFNAQLGDILVADVTIRDGDRLIGTLPESQFRIDKKLAFKDGLAETFEEQVKGANPGDLRVVDIKLSSYVADPSLRGRTVRASFHVKDVKTLRLPELTHEFLHTFDVHNPDQLHEVVQSILERRLEYQQRRSARDQVLEHIAVGSQWNLPEDLLMRQARRALNRRVMEMKAEGIAEAEIAQRVHLMQQDILNSTALTLKEHFVLQKISEVEKIEIDDDDMNNEIERMANQNRESPRRLRARLEKEDLLEALAAEMIERKALDLILDTAEYEDVPLTEEDRPNISSVDVQAVEGTMVDPGADAEAAAKATEDASSNEGK